MDIRPAPARMAMQWMIGVGLALVASMVLAADNDSIIFDIEAQSLERALEAFAEQTRRQVTVDADAIRGVESAAVKGRMHPREALDRLIEGAGLTVVEVNGADFALRARRVDSAPPSERMPADIDEVEEMVVIGKYTINERIDTATGLGLTLHETPQSVSVITSFRIEDQQLQSLTDVVENATGISASALDSSRDEYSARGFLIDNYQVDGVPIAWSGGAQAGETQADTSVYERVEVVRGATGLLTGVGNPSASINLVRKHADSKTPKVETSAAFGRWDTYRVTADVSGPLANDGRVRGRMVLKYEDGDSFRDMAGNTKQVFYGTIDVDVTDRILLRAGASYQDNDPTASTWGGLPSWYSDGTRTDWQRSDTTAATWTSWASTVENYYAEVMHEFSNGWDARVSVNHNINTGDLDLVYLSGVLDRETGLGLTALPTRSDTERKQTSVSFQLSGDYSLFGRDHEFTVGAIDVKEEDVGIRRERSNIAPVGDFFEWDGSYPQPTWGAGIKNLDLENTQSGLYAATRLSMSDRLKVVLGARISDYNRQGFWFVREQDFGDDGVVVPYAGVLYDLAPQHTLYASYTEIFLPQEALDRNFNSLDSILGKSMEVGLKSRFFDGALQTTVAYFDILQDNLAQPDGEPITLDGGGIFQPFKEAEGAQSKGYEMEMVGRLLEGWDVSFSYTHFNVEDAAGQPVNTQHPDEMLKLYSTYRFAGNWDGFTIAGGVNWQTDNYSETVNPVTELPERLTQGSYSLVSLMLRYEFSADLALQLNVDNALDETYFSQIGFFDQSEFGKPRDIALSVNYRF